MKRIFISILVILTFISPVFANNINTDELDFSKMKFSPTENPVTYKYFTDYAEMLRKKINFRRLNPSWGIEFSYRLHSDGTISNLDKTLLDISRRTNAIYLSKFLLKNPPPPYPENMEIGDVDVYIYIQNDTEDATNIQYIKSGAKRLYAGNHVMIMLYKKSIWTSLTDKLFN